MTILANGEEILAADELDRLLDAYIKRGRLKMDDLREALAQLRSSGLFHGLDGTRAEAAIAAAIKRGGVSGPGSSL